MKPLPPDWQRLLLWDWFGLLLKENGHPFPQKGQRGDSFNLSESSGKIAVTAEPVPDAPYLRIATERDDLRSAVETAASEASRRVEAGDTGLGVWYTTRLKTRALEIDSYSPVGGMMRLLNTQHRILGVRRLGADVILEFDEDRPED